MSLYDEINIRDRQRDKEVLRLRKSGWTLTAIGNKYAITRQRVWQILARLAKEGRSNEGAKYDMH